MKKKTLLFIGIAVVLLVIVLVIVFSVAKSDDSSKDSGMSMNQYENNFNGKDHEIYRTDDEDEIDGLSLFGYLEPRDYEVKEVLYAHSGNSGVAIGVIIIECSSESNAKKLEKDSDVILKYMESKYDTKMYPLDTYRDGRFVLIGSIESMTIARGRDTNKVTGTTGTGSYRPTGSNSGTGR